jgi:hypothetical protein
LIDVKATRNTNASLFTTVLCACLGLLIIGTPLQAQASRGTAQAYQSANASTLGSGFGASVVASLQKLRVDDRWLPDSAAQAEVLSKEIFYRKTKPLAFNNQVLIVTRLPRAGLSDLSAEQPKAF